MTKFLMLGAGALLASTAANAGSGSGSFTDPDISANHVTYSYSTPDNGGEDAGSPIAAQFTIKGNVQKTCAISGVDGYVTGLSGTVDLGTIGINAGDDTALADLFTMTGPAHVNIHSAAAGCNYNNTLSVSKDDIRGLVNNNPGGYDSNQFQANIPYEATATFQGVPVNVVGPGSTQTVDVATNANAASGSFGAWRSALDLDVNIPQVTGNGLVGGTYQGTVTLTLQIL